MKSIAKIIILLLLSINCYSQIKNTGAIPYVINYTTDDYKGARQNWIVVQDQRGLMYFGNSDGVVLEFDGQNWNKIKVASTSVTSLCIDDKNTVYVGGDNEIGYLKPTKNGSLIFQSIKNKVPPAFQDFQKIWDIYISKDSSVVFQTFDELFLYKNDSIIVLPVEQYFPEGLFLMTFKPLDEIYIYTKYKGLYQIENNDLKFIDNSSILSNSMVRAVLDYKNDSLLILTWFDGMFTMKDGNFNKINSPIDNILNHNIYRAINIKDDYLGFMLYNGGLLITDKNFKIIQFINVQNGLKNDIIRRAGFDNQDNLWLCTENGISSIYLFSPFSIYEQYYNFDKEATSFYSKIFNDILYIATASGVYYKKWGTYEDKINIDKFNLINNEQGDIKTQFLDIIESKLIAASDNGLYEIQDFKANYILAEGIDRALRGVKVFRIPFDDPNTIIGISTVIFIYKKENNKWELSHDIQNISGNYLEQDDHGNFWVANQTQGIYRIKFDENYTKIDQLTVFDTTSGLNGLPSQLDNKIFKIKDEILFTTIGGIFTYNYNSDKFEPYEKLNSVINEGNQINKKSQIFFITIDSHDNYWYKEQIQLKEQTEYELCLLKKTDTGYIKIKDEFLSLKNKIFFIDQIEDSEYIIGSTEGIIHYDSKIKNNYLISFPAFIRSVKILNSDSIIFNGTFTTTDSLIEFEQKLKDIPTLPYKFGNLRFNFSGAYYQSPQNIQYTYFLEGNDKKWSEWTKENYKDYSNLKPGEYKFMVKARNQFNVESTLATYEFIIKPPWYLTVFAFIGYIIIAGLLIWLIVYLYTRRLRKQKQYLEEQVKLRTKEIEMQKEEILTQRDKLAEQNEKIQKINKDITSSIEYAKRIQTAMLPLEINIKAHLDNYFILFKPRDIVSGDFYWFAQRKDKVFIAAVDCTGHGVPGAFMSMIGAEILTTIVTSENISDASEILVRLNKYVRFALKQDTTENQDGMDMGLCVIDKANNILEYSGAKNPMFYISNDEVFKVKGNRQSIGGFQFGDFEKDTIKYTSPTWFYIFSDGYADQFGGDDHSKFMIKRFKELLFEIHKKPMLEQKQILDENIENWRATTPQTDDILVIGFKL